MALGNRYVFADEAGNFDFSTNSGASRYFILTTVTMEDCRAGDALALLRRELTWRGENVARPFHATDDTHQVRAAVFDLLKRSANYCCWAVQRAWEREDRTYLDILGSKVRTNFDVWATSSAFYY